MSRPSDEIDHEMVAAAIDRAARAADGSGANPAALVAGWFAGRSRVPATARVEAPEASILSAFDDVRGRPLARASSLPAGHPVALAIRRGIDGLRDAFAAKAAEAGASDPGRLGTRLASLWHGAATTGAWGDHRAAAEALLDADGVGARARRLEALRRSEARYRVMFLDSPIRTMVLSPGGRIVQVNRAWERTHGPFAEFARDYCLLEDPQLIEKGLLPDLRRGLSGEAMDLPAVSYVERKGEADERERWTQGFIFPIPDRAGTDRELVLMFEDVTEAKRDGEVARGQAQLLARMLGALAAEPDLDRFLGMVLKAMAEQLAVDTAGLYIASNPDERLRPVMEYDAEGLHPASESAHPDALKTLHPSLTPKEREFIETYRDDGYIYIEDIETTPLDEPYQSFLSRQGIRSILAIHLFLDRRLVGGFSVRSKQKRRFRPEEIALARALGDQAILAIQLTRLARQARETAVLEERNRMAREIHDTLAQGLVAILVQLEAGEDARAREPSEAWRHVARARETARMSLDEARRSVRALRPGVLKDHDLASALPKLVERLADGAPARARFQLVGRPRSLPPAVEDELLRIAQEALVNALRHAKADLIRIELEFGDRGVRLVVEDDGRGGATPDREQCGGGFGLIGMRERAERVGARLLVQDASSGEATRRGTRIVVEFSDRDVGRGGGTDA